MKESSPKSVRPVCALASVITSRVVSTSAPTSQVSRIVAVSLLFAESQPCRTILLLPGEVTDIAKFVPSTVWDPNSPEPQT